MIGYDSCFFGTPYTPFLYFHHPITKIYGDFFTDNQSVAADVREMGHPIVTLPRWLIGVLARAFFYFPFVIARSKG